MQVATPKKGYKMVKMSFGKYEEIPEEWEVEGINQISKIITSGVKKYSGQKEFIQTGDIKHNRIVSSSKYSYEKRPSRANMEVKIDDVLFAKMKETDKVLLISKKDSSFLFSTGFAVLRSEKQKILPQFLRHYVNSTNFQKLKDKFSEGGTLVAINQKEFSRLQILLPSILEQKQIASILSNADDTIQKTDQIIEQTQRLKKGMMQKLLTRGIGHTKFKKIKWYFGKQLEIPEEWEVRKLKEICKKITDGTHNPPKFTSDGIPFLFVSNIMHDKIDFNTKKYISEETFLKLFSRTPVERGDVLYSTVGSLGVAVLVETDKKFSFQRHIGYLKPNRNKIQSNFLVNILNSHLISQQVQILAEGIAQKTLNLTPLKNFLIPLPSLPEQQQIVSILSNIDTQIQKEKIYKSNLEQLKKGLMQKLLTGQIRVKA